MRGGLNMKLKTHYPTPKRLPIFTKTLMVISFTCMFSLFVVAAFYIIFYEKSIGSGLAVLALGIVTVLPLVMLFCDLDRAYIEIKGESILVVDYYFGIRKEKEVFLRDVTAVELSTNCSCRIKGLHERYERYIVFSKDNKYLFKVIYLPETERIFRRYINQ